MASVGDEDDVQKSPKKISKLFGPIFNDSQRTKRIFGKSGNMNHPSVHHRLELVSHPVANSLILVRTIEFLLFLTASGFDIFQYLS